MPASIPGVGLRAGDRCPRCGQPITALYVRVDRRTGRRYLYADHYDPESGKRRLCYLGPVEGYEYARLAPSQANMARADYREAFREALEGLLSRARELAKARKDPGPLRDLMNLLEEYAAHTRETLEGLGYDVEG